MATAPMSQPAVEKKWNPRKLIVANASFFAIFIAVALLILRKWGSPTPWAAVDGYVTAILVLSVLYCIQQLILYPHVFRTKSAMDLFVGKHFDPRMPGLLGLLGMVEMLAFVDYAHWHLVPVLRQRWLQSAGLVIMAAGIVWLFYVDRYMSGHFVEAWERHQLMLAGPFRWVRHPRYGALLLSRLGFTLGIGSVIAYGTLIGWFVVVWIRMVREERYLTSEFGDRYGEFMKTRARLVPHLY